MAITLDEIFKARSNVTIEKTIESSAAKTSYISDSVAIIIFNKPSKVL